MRILAAIVIAALLGITDARAHEEHEHAAGPGLFGQPPEYVHVLLNPLPTYGLGIGILALGAALLARSKSAQAIALGVVIVTAASAWPVQFYGKNAYRHVRSISDEHGQHWLDTHMDRAEKFVYAFYATALLGIAALVCRKKFPKAGLPLTLATLVASGASFGTGIWISRAGGQIRHPEFRAESAPSKPAPHEHGTPGEAHEGMQHEKPSDTTGGHKHEAMPEQPTAKAPLPDTLEGVWKAIHERHSELETAVNDKKFNDVQSHAQAMSDLAKRLVELSHADHKSAVESGVNKVNQSLAALQQSAETGSELVMKNNFDEFAKSLNELEQQMKQQ
ncbi:MAG: hypothetical protein ABS95_02660 [Verrucomicrobia bacterium SCN 57-15]|nr:MAG: hypothetical protein ABS95_02660 [Verrucomicrobia bacterium SCN 57-15]